jgi:hypothetical protein
MAALVVVVIVVTAWVILYERRAKWRKRPVYRTRRQDFTR